MEGGEKGGGMLVPRVTLNSGHQIPVLGFGTAVARKLRTEDWTEIVLEAVRSGYRHFDTATLYGMEKTVGDAVAEAVRQGLIKSREEVFLTSKLWCDHAEAELVIPVGSNIIKSNLKEMGLDYLDLYLIHWPLRLKKKENIFPLTDEDHLPFDLKTTWAAMEECQRLGLVKSIGVSNFSIKKLSYLLSSAKIPPAINQVEVNPLWNQEKLRGFCKEKGIHITAYSPLGANGASWGTNAVMDSPVLKEIAASKGKSLPQICLRWVYEQGVSIAVKSFNKERMKENLQIFDWELSEEEKEKISKIPQMRGCPGKVFLSANGSYRTLEELWDGEI